MQSKLDIVRMADGKLYTIMDMTDESLWTTVCTPIQPNVIQFETRSAYGVEQVSVVTYVDKDSTNDGSARYESKRLAGISPERADGSWCSAENDRQAAAAEEFAAEELGQKYNDCVYDRHGDDHCDFLVPDPLGSQMLGVDVKWLGGSAQDPRPKDKAHLIVNPSDLEKALSVNIYVAVAGSIEKGFEFAGWIWKHELEELPKKNFGFGPKYAVRASELRAISELGAICKPDLG